MLIELCASNYATLDDFVNAVDGILKTSTTYCDKNHHMEYNVSKILNGNINMKDLFF
jgi:hypothetical protein